MPEAEPRAVLAGGDPDDPGEGAVEGLKPAEAAPAGDRGERLVGTLQLTTGQVEPGDLDVPCGRHPGLPSKESLEAALTHVAAGRQ